MCRISKQIEATALAKNEQRLGIGERVEAYPYVADLLKYLMCEMYGSCDLISVTLIDMSVS